MMQSTLRPEPQGVSRFLDLQSVPQRAALERRKWMWKSWSTWDWNQSISALYSVKVTGRCGLFSLGEPPLSAILIMVSSYVIVLYFLDEIGFDDTIIARENRMRSTDKIVMYLP